MNSEASGSDSSAGEDARPPELLDPEDAGISVLTEHLDLLALWHSSTAQLSSAQHHI